MVAGISYVKSHAIIRQDRKVYSFECIEILKMFFTPPSRRSYVECDLGLLSRLRSIYISVIQDLCDVRVHSYTNVKQNHCSETTSASSDVGSVLL
jgi:hypothetical protein